MLFLNSFPIQLWISFRDFSLIFRWESQGNRAVRVIEGLQSSGAWSYVLPPTLSLMGTTKDTKVGQSQDKLRNSEQAGYGLHN